MCYNNIKPIKSYVVKSFEPEISLQKGLKRFYLLLSAIAVILSAYWLGF
jgi:hypothetical protein